MAEPAATPNSAVPTPPSSRRRRSGVVVPERPSRSGRLAARLIYTAVRTVDATLRYEVEDPAETVALTRGQRVIFAIWHNRLALSLTIYHRFIRCRQPARRMAAMVSASRDGGMLARVLELFGVEPVRGSSSRRGAQALLEMTSWAERGLDLAITPDGPRGPRYIVQEGAIAVAQVTGLGIVPVGFHVPWKLQVRSWDRFQIPCPFSRCVLRFGPLIRIPREAGNTEREALRQALEEELRRASPD